MNAGTLTYTGSLSGTYVTGAAISVGSSTNAILNINSSGTITGSTLTIGTNSTGAGAVYQSSGNLTLTSTGPSNTGPEIFQVGSSAGAYGYYNLSGGNLSSNEIAVGGGAAASIGVMDITGGTYTDAGFFNFVRGGGGGTGIVNVTGGSVALTNAVSGGSFLAFGDADTSAAQSVLTIGGGPGSAAVTGTSSSYYISLNFNGSTGLAAANLLGNGTLTIGSVTSGGSGTSLLNFNGGTLKATSGASGNFLASSSMSVYLYGAGGTLDNGGGNITISNNLLAQPATAWPPQLSPRPVRRPTGRHHQRRQRDRRDGLRHDRGGQLTGIVITNPGTGYTGTPTFTLTGGGEPLRPPPPPQRRTSPTPAAELPSRAPAPPRCPAPETPIRAQQPFPAGQRSVCRLPPPTTSPLPRRSASRLVQH